MHAHTRRCDSPPVVSLRHSGEGRNLEVPDTLSPFLEGGHRICFAAGGLEFAAEDPLISPSQRGQGEPPDRGALNPGEMRNPSHQREV
jgi:hypothetical protein